MPQKTCFVVMGFNKKTDYATGRTLDLDKTYRTIIKPAVAAAGLQCIRADEIVHSGVIDVPMYELLLDADVVVADISTMNPNALYELGVRHALRPYTTIVMGESKIAEKSYPFDLSHLLIRSYVHLGEGIDFEEVERVRDELTAAIRTIAAAPKHDSPVYVHLAGLERPQRQTPPAAPVPAPAAMAAVAKSAPGGLPQEAQSHSVMLALGDSAMQTGDFAAAAVCFGAAHQLNPNDIYLVQRVALATYKSKQPDAVTALQKAREHLLTLDPGTSNDPETLGLWGAVHKRLFEIVGDRAALDAAVFAYEKGFYLKSDYYNGINLAFLLSVRSGLGAPAEAIADFVGARRVRARVAEVCLALLKEIEQKAAQASGPPPGGQPTHRAGDGPAEQRYWVVATLAEALLGQGDDAGQSAALAEAYALPVAQWMKDSTKEQLAKLLPLLADSPLKHLQPGSAK
jgi:tetratricopeptide (TPR) repeat protein